MRAVGPRDAVITGTGIVTALGFGAQAVFDALAEGTSGIRVMGDAADGSSRDVAAPVEPPFLRSPVPREMEAQIKFLSGSGELAVEATIEAMAASGIAGAGIDESMRGLYLSQMDSGDWSCHEFRPAVLHATESFANPLEQEAMNRATARFVKPHFMLESLKNNAFSFLSTMFGLRGANTSVAGFAGPTHQALSMGARSVTRGTTDASVVAAAARLSTGSARLEMEAIRMAALPDHNIPGDGAAALVLERAEDAAARGREPMAAVLGQGFATHEPGEAIWAPPPGALNDAMVQAMTEADCSIDDLLGIVTPGVGEGRLDAGGAPVVSWKRATGHLAVASCGVEAALAAQAVKARRLPGARKAGSGSAIVLLTAGLLGQAGALVLAPA